MPTASFDNWTVQVRKGILELCILNALREGERYGYDLVNMLVDLPGLAVTEGTIYPLLSRLRVQELVTTRLEESAEGPARKYYALTREGRKMASMMNEYWDRLHESTRTLRRAGGETMSSWTDGAESEFQNAVASARQAAITEGADPDEVAADLRRHVEEALRHRGVEVADEEEVRKILIRMDVRARPVDPPMDTPLPAAPAPERSRWRPFVWIGGVLLPATALAVELRTGMCAEAFFNPLPTVLHALLVAAAVSSNAVALVILSRGRTPHRHLLGLVGAGLGVSAYYSLIYLPLVPLGLIAVPFLGLGLLPLAPLLCFLSTLHVRSSLRRRFLAAGNARPLQWPAFLAGVLALMALEFPGTVTRIGLHLASRSETPQRLRGLRLLRTLGNRDVMLRACYVRTGTATDLLSFLINLNDPVSPEEARAVFYQVTGTPFNDVPRPKLAGLTRAGLADEPWGTEAAATGGDEVAGRSPDVSLAASRMDGSVDPAAALGYLEWTMVFRNRGVVPREARAQIALPPGSAVSRLTLWIQGEEREAAFGGRARTREAYRQVAVVQRRDPVLVTTAGPDRVLIQCFPIPPAAEMKVRFGITAPLVLDETGRGRLVLPRIIERNFTLLPKGGDDIWIEATSGVSPPRDSALQVEHPADRVFTVRGSLKSSGPAALQFTSPAEASSWTPDGDAVVTQTIGPASPVGASRLVIVLDSSARVKPHLAEILTALEGDLGAGEFALFVADEEPLLLAPPGDAGASTHERIATRLRAQPFSGGRDNLPTLVRAWDLAAASASGRLLWIHGPQPVALTRVEGLRQRWERRPDGPPLHSFSLDDAPNRLMERLEGLPATEWPRLGAITEDLKTCLTALRGRSNAPVARRHRDTTSAAGAPPSGLRTSDHLARLWALDEIRTLLHSSHPDIPAVTDLATSRQLVTPVSGAVVLETAAQYEAADLQPVSSGSVPTIPEPETWMLLLTAIVAGLWAVHLRRGV